MDEDLCTGCEACIERCQFHALKMEEGVSKIAINFCYGCGLCITSCPTEAICLYQKEKADAPPLNDEVWREMREKNRSKF